MTLFFKPLKLNLDFNDWRILNLLGNNYKDMTSPIEYNGKIIDRYRHFFLKNSKTDYSTNIIFKKLANIFVNSSQYAKIEFIYLNSQISLVPAQLYPHIDKRKCVISIPLYPLTAVFWYQSKEIDNKVVYEEIMQYQYCHEAAILNTNILHGIPANQSPRLFFQVGGFQENITDVINQIKSNNIDNT